MAKPPTQANQSQDQHSVVAGVDSFLKTVADTPLSAEIQSGERGRLIFSLDATASRQSTWDQASALQADMFTQTKGIGQLDVQLVYYRGLNECRASPWLQDASKLLGMMNKVTCAAGKTQIERVLKHAVAEAKVKPVQAIVFVGDCVEENMDTLAVLAGELKLLGLPVFVFQEGYDPMASTAFAQIATLSGGAHCRFDLKSASQLGQLLNAVAVYAAGGKAALLRLSDAGSQQAKLLLEQL